MKKVYPYLLLCTLFVLTASAAVAAVDISKTFSQIFIENKGQVKDEQNNPTGNVLFYSQGKEMQLFITSTGYSMVTEQSENQKTTYHKIDVKLEHATIQRDRIIFVKGNHPAFNFYHSGSSLEDVRSAQTIIIQNIYPGIDWVWSFDKNGNAKHEFMVNLGADASVIHYTVTGAGVRLSEINNIVYSNEFMSVTEGPVMLQHNRRNFAGGVSVQGNSVSFQIPPALTGGGFTIDPTLELMWGALHDSLRTSFKSIVANDSFQTFSVGYSSDYAVPTFPQVNGSYSVFPAKNKDLLIMKTDLHQNLVWATFFGGSNNDEANAATSTPNGIFVTGYSDSWDFPQATFGNYTEPVQLFGRDAFVAHFNNVGKWKWSTGYGGDKTDEGLDIKYYNGSVFVAGYTKSDTFPVLTKAGAYNYQDTAITKNDAFILEFDTAGNRKWATCFGGSGNDYFTSLFVDASGIYTTGYSDSVTAASIPLLNPGGGAYYQTGFQKAESFVTKFTSPVHFSGVLILEEMLTITHRAS